MSVVVVLAFSRSLCVCSVQTRTRGSSRKKTEKRFWLPMSAYGVVINEGIRLLTQRRVKREPASCTQPVQPCCFISFFLFDPYKKEGRKREEFFLQGMFGSVAKTHCEARRYLIFSARRLHRLCLKARENFSRRRVRLHLEASDDTADAFLTLPPTLEQLKSLLLRSFPQNRLSDIVIVKRKNADNVAVLMILVICHVEKVEAFPPFFCALNKTKQNKKTQTECPVQ